MELNLKKEQFSFAYIRAVATDAGFAVSEPSVDDDSVDLTISGRNADGAITRPRLDIQAKCTAGEPLDREEFNFSLPKKNYDDLRDPNVLVPRILVVMLVPADVGQWLEADHSRLLLRHCAYWTALRGSESSNNEMTVSVRKPRAQQFSSNTLAAIMMRITQGGHP